MCAPVWTHRVLCVHLCELTVDYVHYVPCTHLRELRTIMCASVHVSCAHVCELGG